MPQNDPTPYDEISKTVDPGGRGPKPVRVRTRPPAVIAKAELTNFALPLAPIEMAPTASIIPYSRTLRPIRERHLAAITSSLATFGFVAPILIDKDNVVVAGHILLLAAMRLGILKVPVLRITHLSPELIQACRVALNKLSEGGRWDKIELKFEMIELAPILDTYDINVETLGFAVAEFDLMLDGSDVAETNEDEADPPAKLAVTRLGDIWVLGGHRLLCGNALDDDAFVRVMGGKKARLTFSDPPYNLKVEGMISGLGKVKHREFAMASGEMSRPDFIAFLTQYMVNCAAHSIDGAVHFACMDWRHLLELITAGEAAFDKFLNLVVWNKTNAGMGTMYRSQHELVGVFKSGMAPHTNTFGLGDTGRYRTNVWTVAGANTFRRGREADLSDHPTVKPTTLVMDAIKDVSRRGEIVLDCFCGSGTTLLAAEKTGRIGRGIELDPIYVDVAVRRWQTLTGKAAILEGDGRSFEDISLARAPTVEVGNV